MAAGPGSRPRGGAGRAWRRRATGRENLSVSDGGSGVAAARPAMVGLKDELLKAIWHAFTALDLDRSGKVSKSQLKARRGAGLGRGGRDRPGARGRPFRSPLGAVNCRRPCGTPGPWLCGAALRVEPLQRPTWPAVELPRRPAPRLGCSRAECGLPRGERGFAALSYLGTHRRISQEAPTVPFFVSQALK